MTSSSPPARPRVPAPPPEAVSAELEIPFHDVDVLEVAWHGHYPKYLEAGRTALMRSRRLDNEDLRALGFRFMILESWLRHLAPLRYGDRVQVHAWFTEVENRLRVAYRIEDLTRGTVAAHAWTVLATISATGALCLETPPAILERLRAPGPGSAGRLEQGRPVKLS